MFVSWYVDRIYNSHRNRNNTVFIVRKVKPQWCLAWIFYNHIRLRKRKQKVVPKYRGKTLPCCKNVQNEDLHLELVRARNRIIHACVNSKKFLQKTLPSAAELILLARLRPTPERLRSASVKALIYSGIIHLCNTHMITFSSKMSFGLVGIRQ
jgi:hypothetical protein